MNLSDGDAGIDEIDKKLVELLNERSQCALGNRQAEAGARIPHCTSPDRRTQCGETGRNNSGHG